MVIQVPFEITSFDSQDTRVRRVEQIGRGESKGRLFMNCSRGTFAISMELHEWFRQQNPFYRSVVTMMFRPGVSYNGTRENGAYVLNFRDPDLAVLFKLAWGGDV